MDNSIQSIYDDIGGIESFRRLSDLFHSRIDSDPVLKEMFPKNLTALTERLALFLAEQTGGPKLYTTARGKNSLHCRHAHLQIGPQEVEAWLTQMFAAMDEVGIIDPARPLLREYFEKTANSLSDPVHHLYRMPLDDLRVILEQNPEVVTNIDTGSSLLCNAAQNWDLPRVQMLLEFGCDVNGRNTNDHDALYYAANAHSPLLEPDGRTLVELLVQHGANVNDVSGIGRMSPLHMTARRGSVMIAATLIKLGAEIDLKDSKGETPLRRAVNCEKLGIVELLLSNGANPLSRDKKGRSVLDAASNEAIHTALLKAI